MEELIGMVKKKKKEKEKRGIREEKREIGSKKEGQYPYFVTLFNTAFMNAKKVYKKQRISRWP